MTKTHRHTYKHTTLSEPSRAQPLLKSATVHSRYLAKLAIVLVLGVALNLFGEPLGLADLLLRQFGHVELGRVSTLLRRTKLTPC